MEIDKAVVTLGNKRVAEFVADCEPLIVEHAEVGYDPYHAGHAAVPLPDDPKVLRQAAANVAGQVYWARCTQMGRAWSLQEVRGFLLDADGGIVAQATAAQSPHAVEQEIKHVNATIAQLREQVTALIQLSHGHLSDRAAAAAAGVSHTHVAKLRTGPLAPSVALHRMEQVLSDAGLPSQDDAAALSPSGRPEDLHLFVRPLCDGRLTILTCHPIPEEELQERRAWTLVDKAADVLRAAGYNVEPVANSCAQTADGRELDMPTYQVTLT